MLQSEPQALNQKECSISLPSLQSLLINWIPSIKESFIIKSNLGKGTFSEVYLASLQTCPEDLYALKYILPKSAPKRIENEIRCLDILKGCDSVIPLECFVHYRGHVVLIMPFVDHEDFKQYIKTMNLLEMRDYMKALFTCLSSVHELGIVHRDIKPSNCLYNSKEKQFTLIDFGLAHIATSAKVADTRHSSVKGPACQCFHEASEVCSTCCQRPSQVSPKSGTQGFKAPEILLKCPNQTSAVDIWSAGIIFLSMLSGKYPFFKVSNDMAALLELITLFGSEECIVTARSLHKELTCSIICQPFNLQKVCESLRAISKEKMKQCDSVKQDCPRKHNSNSAYDLLEKCLDLNPCTRITAFEALQHPFLMN